MLQIKNTVTEMKTAFNGLMSRLEIAEERTSGFTNMTIETSEFVKPKEKKKHLEKNIITKNCGATLKGSTCAMGIPGEDRKEQKQYLQHKSLHIFSNECQNLNHRYRKLRECQRGKMQRNKQKQTNKKSQNLHPNSKNYKEEIFKEARKEKKKYL